MSQRELQRINVIENAVEGRPTISQAAELLQLSPRQVKRLKSERQAADDADRVKHKNQSWRAASTPASMIVTCTKS